MTATTSTGFSTKGWVRINVSGMKANPIVTNAAPRIAAHATILHRRDGSGPSGNNRIRNTPRVRHANHTHDDNQAAYSPPGKAKFSSNA
jgi:hypothetical protein